MQAFQECVIVLFSLILMTILKANAVGLAQRALPLSTRPRVRVRVCFLLETSLSTHYIIAEQAEENSRTMLCANDMLL